LYQSLSAISYEMSCDANIPNLDTKTQPENWVFCIGGQH